MANRILLGDIGGGTMGVKVSRPGANVLTASDDDLLLSSDIDQIQIVQSGIISSVSPGQTINISIPNLGFNPFTVVSCAAHEVEISYPSITIVRFNVWTRPYGYPSLPSALQYMILNRPIT